MVKEKNITAILLMAGVGNRFDSDLPKQFHTINGKAIYLYTLDHFLEKKLFDQIILVCHEKYIERVKKEVPSFIKVIAGGTTRQKSSYLGLLSCQNNTDIVLIHDAVRPFVSQKILEENIQLAITKKAVDTCIPSQDTIVSSIDNKKIDHIPIRKHFLRGQTPQTFCYSLIVEAHKKAISENFSSTDDCSLVLQLGYPVSIASGSEKNIKITNKEDLLYAQSLIQIEEEKTIASTQSLKNKTFLLVGGSGGIGKAITLLLEKEKAKVLSLSRTSFPYHLDLTSYESIHHTFKKIKEEIGPVDGLINSAGLLKIKPFKDLCQKEIFELLSVNLLGVIYCCKEVLLNKRGHIINIASSSYTKGRKNYSLYSSAKAGVVNFTEGLCLERPDLYINTIVPERTNTSMRSIHFPKESINSLLEPEIVAKKVVQILKAKITGKIFSVRKSSI